MPAETLADAAAKLADEIAAAGPLALAAAKRAIDEGAALPLVDGLAVEAACYEEVLASEDRNEGLAAFAEKRHARVQRTVTDPMSRIDDFKAQSDKAKRGGAPKYHESNAAAGKLFCRERIALLCDDGGKDFAEDGLLANATAPDLPADGVVTGIGRVHGRPVAIMANDSTVKAGSWGARTVEKIIRIQETAGRLRFRSSTWSIRRARASPIRSTCSRGGGTRAASSPTR